MSDSNLLTSMPSQTATSQGYNNYADVGALNDLKRQAREDQRAALRPVAEQFEALFVQQVLKEARKVSFDDNWLDGSDGDFYKDWYDKQLSQDLSAKGTLGFADKIVEQLAPREQSVSKRDDSFPKDSDMKTQNIEKELPTTEQALALRKIK
ncbi:rod-binding protein [Thiomicrorhabdus sp. ZW0627]|uniref:rod-binding protein n=1 Tax=Thiomicrorhabdus sp. ZW0627 TaxID=3039774 RepID=UPI00243636A9|nr:rod-binding protein [Thiomicrorhabdus sp. ZW0627]MDG6773370.1 rod-binding protein [Thiomicrorhabdus sp. ZW0627]